MTQHPTSPTVDAVLKTLTEKIHRQERFIAELQADLERARQASVGTMLGQFRLREAVLLSPWVRIVVASIES